MVLFNYSTKELTAKVVYYGAGLCGKTTNLQWIHEKLPIKNKGKMLSLATETDRTLFFDFLPIEIGAIRGMRTRIQLYTVPGQVFYNATRRMVLKGADAVVFVCDSQEPMLEANVESFENMRQNLEANDLPAEEIPVVFQYNKRDLPNALPIEILNERLNRRNFPFYEAVAVKGIGVEDTLKAVTKLVFRSLSARYGDGGAAGSSPTRSSAAGRPALTPDDSATVLAPALTPGTGELLADLSSTPGPQAAPRAAVPPSRPPAPVSAPPLRSAAPVRPAAPAPPVTAPRTPTVPPGPSEPEPFLEDLTLPTPRLHADVETPPPPPRAARSPQQTLVSSADEAQELRRRIAAPRPPTPPPPPHAVEDLSLEEIEDLEADVEVPLEVPLEIAAPPRAQPRPAPPPTLTPAPPPYEAPTPRERPAPEIEIPIEVQVPPGATRVQLRLKLVLNLKQR